MRNLFYALFFLTFLLGLTACHDQQSSKQSSDTTPGFRKDTTYVIEFDSLGRPTERLLSVDTLLIGQKE